MSSHWDEADYKAEAYERLIPLIGRIIKSQYPQGVLNLFSGLPEDIDNPDEKMAQRIKSYIWGQIQQLKGEFPEELGTYNLELRIERRSRGWIIQFVFSPDDPRKLSLGDRNRDLEK
ncbi:hypothetical protein C5B42_05745 [Candidatus Cerribacteria bacterium 'Amazon FNV 2010 28 9']|uniref:Uncharacterized protein n=1 Tax=Candidatus Cerribacteria bacterium 'Amazon FNV 2010 28 9' TaxID=2081795 RepID=A0A317JNH4_9BACT|nr:MAG: hypothetical protein C5B42_05745 [Candidatus Cerribacteria bacterium 'Amazon FNV 2010 28 9']